MISFSFVLVLVTVLFMLLGALLFEYAKSQGIALPLMDGKAKTDLLFPEIALNGGLGPVLSITFMLGLLAAAYSSADSALTSLTTSFCIDFLKNHNPSKAMRRRVHVAMSLILVVVIIAFKYLLNSNVIDSLLTVAGYTYGPLLGLFAFGMFTKWQIRDQYTLYVCIAIVLLITLIGRLPAEQLGGYQLGYELLPLNGLLTFCGLWLLRKGKVNTAL